MICVRAHKTNGRDHNNHRGNMDSMMFLWNGKITLKKANKTALKTIYQYKNG